MDGITSAVLRVAMERQGQQLQSNAVLVREAKKSDAAVLQLLDAAKALEEPPADQRDPSRRETGGGKGSILNLIA